MHVGGERRMCARKSREDKGHSVRKVWNHLYWWGEWYCAKRQARLNDSNFLQATDLY